LVAERLGDTGGFVAWSDGKEAAIALAMTQGPGPNTMYNLEDHRN